MIPIEILAGTRTDIPLMRRVTGWKWRRTRSTTAIYVPFYANRVVQIDPALRWLYLPWNSAALRLAPSAVFRFVRGIEIDRRFGYLISVECWRNARTYVDTVAWQLFSGEIRLLRANKLLVPVTTRRGRVSRRAYLERRLRDATRASSSYSRERKSARRMRKEEVAVNISSAAISSVSIYDDEVTRYRVRKCRAFECKRLHIRSKHRYIFPPTRKSFSTSEKEKKEREAVESSGVESGESLSHR